MECSVKDCSNEADFKVILYDFYYNADGTLFYEQDKTCPYICVEHAMENEQLADGERKPRGIIKYPFTNQYNAQGFTIYHPIDE